MVSDAALRKVVGADALRAVSGAHLKPAAVGIFAVLLFALKLVQAGLQHAHGLFAVLDLAALILTGDHQTGGDVGDAHGGIGAVDVLAACTRRAVGVDAQVVHVDLDLHVLGLGQHGHGGGGGVDAAGGLRDRHALHAVDAGLKLQLLEHVLSLNEHGALLEATELGGAVLDQLGLPAVLVGIVHVHAQQLCAEQTGLVAARACAHLQHCVFVVVGILRQQGDARFAGLFCQLLLQQFQLFLGHIGHVRIGQHLARAVDFAEQPAIVHGQRVQLGQIAVLAHELGERGGIGDDLGQRNSDGKLLKAGFNGFQLTGDALLFVKGVALQNQTLLAQTMRGMPLRSLVTPACAHTIFSVTRESTGSASPMPTSRKMNPPGFR